MASSYVLDVPNKAEMIAKALAERGIAPAVYDFIRYNLGEGAANAAILVGAPVSHQTAAGDCGCS